MNVPPSPPANGAEPTRIGPYEVVRRIGRGGMGEVWEAFDSRLHRPVAIKRLRSRVAIAELQRRRLLREARLAARLNHPSIVRIHDLLSVDGSDHIVMELVDGTPLRRLLAIRRPPLKEALDIGLRIAEGLEHAHGHHLVHRDLKTENVLVGDQGEVKIVDFGLARPAAGGEPITELTKPGAVIGTCRSMSPEQALGQELDERSDLFSLGILYYELFTGCSPFLGATQLATLQQVVQSPHLPALDVEPGLPPNLSALIDELLEKDPQERPAGGSVEVARRLREIRDELPAILTAPPSPRDASSAGDDISTAERRPSTESGDHEPTRVHGRRPSRRMLAVGLTALLTAALLAAALWTGSCGGEAAPENAEAGEEMSTVDRSPGQRALRVVSA